MVRLAILVFLGMITAGAILIYLNKSASSPSPDPPTPTSDPSSLVGTKAPDFIVVNGPAPTRLSDYRGHLVLLNFWASYSPPSIEEIPSLGKLRQDWPALSVIAVSEDEDRAAFKAFLERHRPDLVAVRDAKKATANLYHTSMWPETYVIDRQGVIRRKFTGAQDWSSPEIRTYLNSL